MKFISYNNTSFKKTTYYKRLPENEREVFDILSSVFHFKVNNYVLEHLIDWETVPNDPIYKLIFPRKEMLQPTDYKTLLLLHQSGLDEKTLFQFVQKVKKKMYPEVKHAETSIPKVNGVRIRGMYSNFETIVSLFPDPMAKTCHSYCSYCFRWIMFNNKEAQQNSSYTDPNEPVEYLRAHPEITDVLFTGADPLVLKAKTLQNYIDPVLDIESVKVIRISSKSLAWWPFRFTTDTDADELLKLFRYIQSRGKHLNFCAHFTHVRELENDVVKEAIQRIRDTGTVIRCQGPIVEGINDTPEDWSALWNTQIALGMVPYYMFIEADHNSESCFRIPLAKALQIFQEAQKKTTGLARTVRGPVFMNDLHRTLLDGIVTVNDQRYFALKSLQAPPNMVGEGTIKLIPYSETTKDAGDLIALFSKEQEARSTTVDIL
ncbi:KamA family radical SAM protein [Aquimarina algiphila]|uniref:KamA family radical SAM protein n=1 Tax=Aquimarina algiphila TaxID=2047982 RepID=UPI002330D02B|nr:lysine 2,3-aminomutase [Aquimarina algiphila]